MAEVQAFVAENMPGTSPRWSAHTEIERSGGADLGETIHGEDPDELIEWARSRTRVVYVRFWESGSWWAGEGDAPAFDPDDPVDDPSAHEGVWPPAPGSHWADRLHS